MDKKLKVFHEGDLESGMPVTVWRNEAEDILVQFGYMTFPFTIKDFLSVADVFEKAAESFTEEEMRMRMRMWMSKRKGDKI